MLASYKITIAIFMALIIGVGLWPQDFITYQVSISKPAHKAGRITIPLPMREGRPDRAMIKALAQSVAKDGDRLDLNPDGLQITIDPAGTKRTWTASIKGRRLVDLSSAETMPVLEGIMASQSKGRNGRLIKMLRCRVRGFNGDVRINLTYAARSSGLFLSSERQERAVFEANGDAVIVSPSKTGQSSVR